MKENSEFEVIIIGGSYAGLSAGMALGRALRRVLILDNGSPCNKQTPQSHNFITHDGERPGEIAAKAKEQVSKYKTVSFREDLAVEGTKTATGFAVTTQKGDVLYAEKLIFATGVRDLMPAIEGFAACWGISVIHCPYCHGYEVRGEKTGILAHGDMALHYARLIRNWTKDLTIFTHGEPAFTAEQAAKLQQHGIAVVTKEIASFAHTDGEIQHVVFKDGSTFGLKALYARPDFEQQCKIPERLGCAITEHGHIEVDFFQKTTVDGVFACGDSSSMMRAVSYAVSSGNIAGAMLNNEMTEIAFENDMEN